MGSYNFDWYVVRQYWPELLGGLTITLQISLVGMALALVIGLGLDLSRTSRIKPLAIFGRQATNLCRSIPLFVLLFWIYYGFSLKFQINLNEFQAGALALGITGGGYMAEIYRGGLLGVDDGQREGALAIGLSRAQAMRLVIFPQAMRILLPPTVNVYVGLIKGATIVSVIGVADMMYVAQYVSLETFSPFELYAVAGTVFVAVTISVSALAYMLERRLSRGVAHV
jgi:His/Glu/Gln/Arg/opine family amino acid ABC transporter permease subunit